MCAFPPTGLNGESAAANGIEKNCGASPRGTEPLTREKCGRGGGGGYGLKGAPKEDPSVSKKFAATSLDHVGDSSQVHLVSSCLTG